MSFDEDAANYKAIIKSSLDENADLLIGIDDPELSQLIDVLVDGVSQAIAASKDEIKSDLDTLGKNIGLR